eukprot:765824-Hanusia_phi.AAC.4
MSEHAQGECESEQMRLNPRGGGGESRRVGVTPVVALEENTSEGVEVLDGLRKLDTRAIPESKATQTEIQDGGGGTRLALKAYRSRGDRMGKRGWHGRGSYSGTPGIDNDPPLCYINEGWVSLFFYGLASAAGSTMIPRMPGPVCRNHSVRLASDDGRARAGHRD